MTYSVIPPYILRNIIDNCSGAQQDYARRTLIHVQQLMVQHTHTVSAASTAQPGNGDVAAEKAWNYLGITYDFFWKIFKRNSLDNKGLKLDGTMHYDKEYQNAFWNGQQMVFGDDDG